MFLKCAFILGYKNNFKENIKYFDDPINRCYYADHHCIGCSAVYLCACATDARTREAMLGLNGSKWDGQLCEWNRVHQLAVETADVFPMFGGCCCSWLLFILPLLPCPPPPKKRYAHINKRFVMDQATGRNCNRIYFWKFARWITESSINP